MFVLWVSAFSFLQVILCEKLSGSRGMCRDTRSWTRRASWPRGPGVGSRTSPNWLGQGCLVPWTTFLSRESVRPAVPATELRGSCWEPQRLGRDYGRPFGSTRELSLSKGWETCSVWNTTTLEGFDFCLSESSPRTS